MSIRNALILVFCLAALAGCKKSAPRYDRSTPDKTLTSFFHAIKSGRIPADLDTFVATPVELSAWRLRCKTHGCKAGAFQVVGRKIEGYRATLTVNYTVTGKYRVPVMHGDHSPITFERQGNTWYIVQFGKHVTVSTARRAAPRGGTPPSGPRDAGARAGASGHR